MLVRRFVDEYRGVGRLLDTTEGELRRLDASGAPLRWVSLEGEDVVGVIEARRRPDGRSFVRFGRTPPGLIGPLSDAAAVELGSVHTVARSAEQRRELGETGFEVEFVDDEFEISFDSALRKLGRLRMPRRYDLASPDDLDDVRLAALDTELRQDVPGTNGWETTAEMWRAEIDSPQYDPSGYWVAVDEVTGAYCGLIRIWRNADQPRLGLLAVTRPHRGSLLAAALLRAGLEGASRWGSRTFATSTSPTNQGTYPALVRLGVRPVGRRYQMVLTTDF